jgi:hypothetical protein
LKIVKVVDREGKEEEEVRRFEWKKNRRCPEKIGMGD